ncbi:CDP-glycerol:poly(glycerophosphate) glycerophosphotransferase [Providencia rustigianii]|uniref:CDP-glycerol:poly(Glycerophosphate) glycerophosphotransferase n=1 Tax=Providencia rustigianii TaxID=158850 RepID=A0A379G8U8_9GAMM|nr:CDP-glycerol glycerophosphotransferase family protein [Providencia rustigianii]SUC37301.1 CDP-glycerol:poly(glycerophosphate) glycerophosphotransferase [Providencia rustigianii]
MFKFLSLFFGSLCIFFTKLMPLKNRIILTSTGNIAYNFNSAPLFEFLIEKKINNWEVVYVINSNEIASKIKSKLPHNAKIINTTNIKDLIYASRSKIWISSSLNVPVFSFLYDNRRIVLHLGHGIPLKKIGLAESNITKFQRLNRLILTRAFTDVISYSNELTPILTQTFGTADINFHHFGQPRNDYLKSNDSDILNFLENHKNITSEHTLLLYAPTWRPYADTLLFPFESIDNYSFQKFLNDNKIVIFIRSHPFYGAYFNSNITYSENIIDLSVKIEPDINKILDAFDGLITDYSSIYFDFLCLNKPVYFIPYDIKKYETEIGFNIDYNYFTPGSKILSYHDLLLALLHKSKIDEKKVKCILKITNTKSFGNCEEIYNYLNKLTTKTGKQ